MYKRAIYITGNTPIITNRIRSACKQFDCDFVISEDLKEQLTLHNDYIVNCLGQISLKGRTQPIILCQLKEKNDNPKH